MDCLKTNNLAAKRSWPKETLEFHFSNGDAVREVVWYLSNGPFNIPLHLICWEFLWFHRTTTVRQQQQQLNANKRVLHTDTAVEPHGWPIIQLSQIEFRKMGRSGGYALQILLEIYLHLHRSSLTKGMVSSRFQFFFSTMKNTTQHSSLIGESILLYHHHYYYYYYYYCGNVDAFWLGNGIRTFQTVCWSVTNCNEYTLECII